MNKSPLIKLYERIKGSSVNRESLGVFAGGVGIAANLLLFAVKMAVGLLSGSVSITADAVNNLSDAGSSAVTLFGFRMAQKPADGRHPYGHARMEYMAGAAVSIVILLIGVELMRISVQSITDPQPTSYSALSFAVLAFSIAVKLGLASFYHNAAVTMASTALEASAGDSRSDVIATLAVAAGAALQAATNICADGWIGAAVAIFIMISGIKLLYDTSDPLLGEAPDEKLVCALTHIISTRDGVLGMHDLMVHSYGPSRIYATAHVEMDAKNDPMVSHGVLDSIENDVLERLNVHLTLHLDPVQTDDRELSDIYEKLTAALAEFDPSLVLHDLRISRTSYQAKLIFDVGVPPQVKADDAEIGQAVDKAVAELGPQYRAAVNIDRNYGASL